MTSEVIMAKTKAMIDDLKTVCENYYRGIFIQVFK